MNRETVYTVEKKDQKGEAKLLFVCKTLPAAVSRIREYVGEDNSWHPRYNGLIWNNDRECIVVVERALEG